MLLKRGSSANTPTRIGGMTSLFLVAQTATNQNFEAQCGAAELLYKHGGNPKALTTNGARIINNTTLPEMKNFLIKHDTRFVAHLAVIPEQRQRWLEDKKERKGARGNLTSRRH